MVKKSSTSSERKITISAILLGVFFLSFCAFLYFASISCCVGEWRFEANWFDPQDTATAFTYSLAHNRTSSMKPFVDEKLWPFLDRWTTIHQQVSDQCTVPDDPDLGSFLMGGSADPSDTARVAFSLHYGCPDFYTLSSTTYLKMINGRWKVVGWDELCEHSIHAQECYSQ